MKCSFCGQVVREGDRHRDQREPTDQERREFPDVAVMIVCRVQMIVETPALLGRISNG